VGHLAVTLYNLTLQLLQLSFAITTTFFESKQLNLGLAGKANSQ